MSDDESTDGLEDLQELMAIYGKNDKPNKKTARPLHKENDEDAEEQEKKTETGTETGYVEVPMEKVIFGDKQAFLANLAKSVGKRRPSQYNKEQSERDDDEEQANSAKKPKPAWTDSDDEEFEVGDVKRETRHTGPLNHLRTDKSYKEYLTARFQRTTNQPKWADLEQKKEKADSDESDNSDVDESLLRTVGFIDRKAKSKQLCPKSIHFKRVKDLNRATYSEGNVKSVQFHPTSTAAIVAGESCLATIYSVDGTKNEKLHNVRFPKFPITCGRISPCGTRAYFGSMKPYFYAYDLLEAKASQLKMPVDSRSEKFELSPCGKYIAMVGKFGAIHLLHVKSNELLHSFKQESHCRGISFTADSQRLICSGTSCNVNVLSLRQKCIEHSFIDDGCVKGLSLALSPSQRLLATGSMEGVVNVYDYESIYKSTVPQPLKRFMNLRTAIGDLQFNHTSELLAMSSSLVPSSLKLAHFPSATVYANFPHQMDNLGYVNTIAFSPHSGYLAVGIKGKKVPLFRLKYFKNY
ncbi:hypothetical protein ACLKA7_000602 [Drosophila subpalustris]